LRLSYSKTITGVIPHSFLLTSSNDSLSYYELLEFIVRQSFKEVNRKLAPDTSGVGRVETRIDKQAEKYDSFFLLFSLILFFVLISLLPLLFYLFLR
jgi:cytoskeletal protein RodZ